MQEFIRDKIHKQQQKEYSAFDDNSKQPTDHIEDDMIVLKTPNVSGSVEKFNDDQKPQMTQYFCTQRFMLFWVKKIRNAIRRYEENYTTNTYDDVYAQITGYDIYIQRFKEYVSLYNKVPESAHYAEGTFLGRR